MLRGAVGCLSDDAVAMSPLVVRCGAARRTLGPLRSRPPRTHTHTAATPVTVATIGVAIETGTFSPVLTAGSFPVIDGVVTSFDAIARVRAKALMPQFESVLRATGTANLFRRLIFGAGLKFIDGFETWGGSPPYGNSKDSPSLFATVFGALVTSA